MATHPEYSSAALQIASDTSYSAQGDAYDGTLVKPATQPALALITQGARPQRQMAARIRNWLDSQLAAVCNALISDVTYLGAGVDPSVNGMRLSVATSPVPLVDTVGASTLYLVRSTSSSLWLYDQASGAWNLRSPTAIVGLNLTGLTAGQNYDVFAYWDGSTIALELGAAWGSDTPPVLVTMGNGVVVKGATSALQTRRLVGSIRATSATTTEDSVSKRFVWNAANRVRRHLLVSDPTASWTYNLAAFRQVRAQTANKVEVLIREAAPIEAYAVALATGGASGIRPLAGIGIDSTTVNSGITFGDASSTNYSTETNQTRCEYDGVLPAGYHALNWLEALSTATSSTLFGTAGGSTSHMRARLVM